MNRSAVLGIGGCVVAWVVGCSQAQTAAESAGGGGMGMIDASGAGGVGGAGGAGAGGGVVDGGRVEVALPLSTCGRWIVDQDRRRVKLAGVNWYGASDVKHVVGGLDRMTLERIVGTIVELGFNSVRLPFS